MRALLLISCFLAFPLAAAAESVTIVSSRDNTLFEDADGDTSNGSGTGVFCGRNSQGRARRALLAFDLAAIPEGALVDSARLELHMASSSDLSQRVLSLHRVLADWGEGGSASAGGGGAPAQPGDATWLHTFYPSSFWSAPGGDFAAAASAATTVLGEGDYVWRSVALTDDVRAWLAQAAGNHGWILLGDESVANTARRFDSRESTTPSFRPRLVVHYRTATGVPDHGPGAGAELGSCYPNPATGAVRLRFRLPAAAHAQLVVEDVAGRRVATVLDRGLPSGAHEAVWDGRAAGAGSARPGVYFYRLVVNGRSTLARRVAIVR